MSMRSKRTTAKAPRNRTVQTGGLTSCLPNGLEWSGRVDSNHRPPGPEPGALARLSHAPNSIAGNPGAGGSKARQRASAPAINCEFSITLGSACRIARGLDKFRHTGFLWVPGIWVDPIVGCSKNGTRYCRWRGWDQRSVFAQCDKTARVSLSVTQRSSWTANAVNTHRPFARRDSRPINK